MGKVKKATLKLELMMNKEKNYKVRKSKRLDIIYKYLCANKKTADGAKKLKGVKKLSEEERKKITRKIRNGLRRYYEAIEKRW